MELYAGPSLARYSFGDGHPFGPDRFDVFWERVQHTGLADRAEIREPRQGTRNDLLLFHTEDYINRVAALSHVGRGMLDPDTPVFTGIYEAALTVVGTVLEAVSRVMDGSARTAFVPIAGLHHAHPDHSSGFCVFNDCAIAIRALQIRHGLRPIAYVDIDAHHADGVFYGSEDDPDVIFADLHEDGRYLFPGTGDSSELGRGTAAGRKLNIPLAPGADDTLFHEAWPHVEDLLVRLEPAFIILQCGADSIRDDPLTDLNFTVAAHRYATERLVGLANQLCGGRLVALGGGGYNRRNIADAWTAVVETLIDAE